MTKYGSSNPTVSLRLGNVLDDVNARTNATTSRAETIRRDLGRYYRLMRDEVATLDLTRAEMCAVMDARKRDTSPLTSGRRCLMPAAKD